MNVLCQLDRPMFMGGRVMILWDGVGKVFCFLVFMYWERIITTPGGRVGGMYRRPWETAMVRRQSGQLRAVSCERSQHAPGSSMEAQTLHHLSLASVEWQVTQEVAQ